MIKEISKCRLCDSSEITEIWNFGDSVLANDFRVNKDDKQESFPLVYFKCNNCHSVQLKYEIAPEILFKDYNYESPPNLIPHFKELAETTSKFLNLKPKDHTFENRYIIDIGSNNGLLLQEFKKLGYVVLGYEPATKIAQKAANNGVRTIPQFFDKEYAKQIGIWSLNPQLITATNIFAHVPNLNEFVEILASVMPEDCYFVFENAYLLNTIENLDLGQAYHEHQYMHSILPLIRLFQRHDLELFKIEYNNVQMGSIRGYVRKLENPENKIDKSVGAGLVKERDFGLWELETYKNFIKKIDNISTSLNKKLENIKKENKSISIFGWPAKMTLLNKYFDIEKYIDYVIEESEVKINKFAPGTNLGIYPVSRFRNYPTDYCIIGAYNFFDDIVKKNEWYQGKFINPLNI